MRRILSRLWLSWFFLSRFKGIVVGSVTRTSARGRPLCETGHFCVKYAAVLLAFRGFLLTVELRTDAWEASCSQLEFVYLEFWVP